MQARIDAAAVRRLPVDLAIRRAIELHRHTAGCGFHNEMGAAEHELAVVQPRRRQIGAEKRQRRRPDFRRAQEGDPAAEIEPRRRTDERQPFAIGARHFPFAETNLDAARMQHSVDGREAQGRAQRIADRDLHAQRRRRIAADRKAYRQCLLRRLGQRRRQRGSHPEQLAGHQQMPAVDTRKRQAQAKQRAPAQTLA